MRVIVDPLLWLFSPPFLPWKTLLGANVMDVGLAIFPSSRDRPPSEVVWVLMCLQRSTHRAQLTSGRHGRHRAWIRRETCSCS